MKTKIAIASDDVGFARKEEIKKYLIEEKNMEIVYDPVTCKEQGVNNFARLADEMAGIIQRDECRLGIYICGTGIARLSNNAQVIGLGCRVNDLEYSKMIVDAWLDNPFDFTTARENSKKNLLEAERNDNALLVKPADVRWNMGFRPDDEKSEG